MNWDERELTLQRIEGELLSAWLARAKRYLLDGAPEIPPQGPDNSSKKRTAEFRTAGTPRLWYLCEDEPFGSFILWKAFEEELRGSSLGSDKDREKRMKEWCDACGAFFVAQGHWRKLDPVSDELLTNEKEFTAYIQEIRRFTAESRKKATPVTFDAVTFTVDDTPENPMVIWNYSLSGQSELSLGVPEKAWRSADAIHQVRFRDEGPSGFTVGEQPRNFRFVILHFNNACTMLLFLSVKEQGHPHGRVYKNGGVRCYPERFSETGDYELRKRFGQPAQEEDPKQDTKPVAAPPRFMLRRGSGQWTFVCDGLSGFTDDWKGMHYVEYLLKNPPQQPIHATELEAQVCDTNPATAGITEIINPATGKVEPLLRTASLQERNLGIDDREANRAAWKDRKACQQIIEDTEASEAERRDAQREQDEISKKLNSAALSYKANAAKLYDRIRKVINRVCDKLGEKRTKEGDTDPAYEAFAEHIRMYLIARSKRFCGSSTSRQRTKTAQTFTYEPPDGVIWSD